MEDLSKAVFAFSKLKEINSKRCACYTAAADRVKNAYLKTVFMNYAFLAQQLNVELNRWLNAYGATPASKSESFTKTTWERMKSMLVIESEQSVYSGCEALEEEALRAYNTAISLSFFPHAALKDVERHTRDIDKIRTNIKFMRETNARQLKVA